MARSAISTARRIQVSSPSSLAMRSWGSQGSVAINRQPGAACSIRRISSRRMARYSTPIFLPARSSASATW